MAVSYRVDHGQKRVWQVGRDAVDCADMFAVLDQVVAEGAWRYATLADFRQATQAPDIADITRTTAHVQHLAAVHGPRGPVALVVPPDSALLGMMQMYSTVARVGQVNVAVFTTTEDAERWLAANGCVEIA